MSDLQYSVLFPDLLQSTGAQPLQYIDLLYSHAWQGHAQCSEPFYKKELESDILGDTAKKEDEKRRMMELLQRFEESSPPSDHDDEDEDEDNILDRFQNMDIRTLLLVYSCLSSYL